MAEGPDVHQRERLLSAEVNDLRKRLADALDQLGKVSALLGAALQGLRTTAIYDVTNLGAVYSSTGRPARYFECRLCGDWSDEAKHIEHAEGCPLYVGHPRLQKDDAVRPEKPTPQSVLPGEQESLGRPQLYPAGTMFEPSPDGMEPIKKDTKG